jgi:5'-nucleotidase
MGLVLSGINAGGNLGVDIYMSGTVAAVREAAFHGIPGIAVSHYRHGQRPYHWQAASRWTAQIVTKLLSLPHQPGSFWNVNLPHLLPDAPDPEVIFCKSSNHPLPVVYQPGDSGFTYAGKYRERSRGEGTDVEVCFAGAIAVTQIFV